VRREVVLTCDARSRAGGNAGWAGDRRPSAGADGGGATADSGGARAAGLHDWDRRCGRGACTTVKQSDTRAGRSTLLAARGRTCILAAMLCPRHGPARCRAAGLGYSIDNASLQGCPANLDGHPLGEALNAIMGHRASWSVAMRSDHHMQRESAPTPSDRPDPSGCTTHGCTTNT